LNLRATLTLDRLIYRSKPNSKFTSSSVLLISSRLDATSCSYFLLSSIRAISPLVRKAMGSIASAPKASEHFIIKSKSLQVGISDRSLQANSSWMASNLSPNISIRFSLVILYFSSISSFLKAFAAPIS